MSTRESLHEGSSPELLQTLKSDAVLPRSHTSLATVFMHSNQLKQSKHWIGLDWIGLDWIGLDWINDWIGDWIGLMIDWIGLVIGLD